MTAKFLIYLGIMFGVTYLIRAIPLLLIKHKIENKFIRSFLAYVPYTVLGAMTFPAIFHIAQNPLCGIVGALVGCVLAFFGRGLCTVAAGTAAATYIMMLIL